MTAPGADALTTDGGSAPANPVSADPEAIRPEADSQPVEALHYIAARPLRSLSFDPLSADAGHYMPAAVTIEFTLAADGSASDVAVVKAASSQELNRVATRAVLRERYNVAALRDQQPARARIRVVFNADGP
jgi:TonB family protein